MGTINMHLFLLISLYINTSWCLTNNCHDLKSTYLTVLYSYFLWFLPILYTMSLATYFSFSLLLTLQPILHLTQDVSSYRSMMLNLLIYFSLLVSLSYSRYPILFVLFYFNCQPKLRHFFILLWIIFILENKNVWNSFQRKSQIVLYLLIK